MGRGGSGKRARPARLVAVSFYPSVCSCALAASVYTHRRQHMRSCSWVEVLLVAQNVLPLCAFTLAMVAVWVKVHRAQRKEGERKGKGGMQEAQHKTSSSETTHSRIVHISGVKPLTMGGLVKEAYWRDDSWFSGQICLSKFRNGLWSASV